MRAATRLCALLTLPGLLLAACQAAPAPSATAAVRDVPVAELTGRLPAEAAGFYRGDTTALPLGEDGRETGYRTRGRTAAGATVALYRQPGTRVPEGAGSPAAAEAFDQLVKDATRSSPQRQLHLQGEFTMPALGESPAAATLRCAETAGVYGRERVQGLLCAGGIGGGLLRLRVTMPQRDPLPADARAFAAAIMAALRTP